MSDFLKSLFARSFGLEEGLETVRPRLPSLFEPPQTRSLSSDIQTLEESGEAQNSGIENRALNPAEINPLEPDWRRSGNRDPGLKEARPITLSVPQHSDGDENSKSNSAADGLSHSRHAAPLAKNQPHLNGSVLSPETEDIISFSKQEPLRRDEVQLNIRQVAENKSIISTVHRPPVATHLSLGPDFKPATPEVTPIDQRAKNALQISQEAEQSSVLQPAALVADMSVLKQLVKDQVSLHTKEDPIRGDNKISTAPNQSVILPQADSPKFNSIGLGLKPVTHPFENKSVNSGKELEPTIQVTIGRIEIRATPPSSPARKNTEKKASTMSLEEYLNKRNGGAR